METLDYDHNMFDPVNMAASKADENLAVRFYIAPVQDMEETAKQGRPIFRDTKMVEIRVRGDRNNIVVRPVREEDKRRFAGPWKAFESQEALVVDGTPLREWPMMSTSMVEELKYMGFYTVEHLANASDTVVGKFAGLGIWKQKAKAFLELAAGGAPVSKLQKENEDLRSTNEMLKRQLDELSAKVATLAEKSTA